MWLEHLGAQSRLPSQTIPVPTETESQRDGRDSDDAPVVLITSRGDRYRERRTGRAEPENVLPDRREPEALHSDENEVCAMLLRGAFSVGSQGPGCFAMAEFGNPPQPIWVVQSDRLQKSGGLSVQP